MSEEKDSASKKPGSSSEEKAKRTDEGRVDQDDLEGSQADIGESLPDDEPEGDDDEPEGDDDEPEGDDDEPEGDDDEPEGDDGEPWDRDLSLVSGAEDDIDPDLLALGEEKPGPRLHRPIIMTVVCILIVVMMAWFRHDLLYFFTPNEPIDLGPAHDIEFDASWENRYIRFDGWPLAPSVTGNDPSCGRLQGFPTYQRRVLCRGHQSAIPLMGRPEHDLIVQRYLVRQLRISYSAPEGREEQTHILAESAALRISAVQKVSRTGPGELGHMIAEVEGNPGKTDIDAVAKSIRFQIEASVPGVKRVSVERVRRDPPGSFEGRLVRLRDLGSRFAAVGDFLNECTTYEVDGDTWVVLDGSEAGSDAWDSEGLCYGQAPRQYWPYLVLYFLLGVILILNIYLLVRFLMAARRR
jgi:hypothetical protein